MIDPNVIVDPRSLKQIVKEVYRQLLTAFDQSPLFKPSLLILRPQLQDTT